MNDRKFIAGFAVLSCVLGLGCQDQAYVSPDTVALVVRDKASDVQRVNHCSYVPVLLGGRDEAIYDIESGMTAKFTLTRERIAVTFEGAHNAEGDDVTPWVVSASSLESGTTKVDDDPPEGYAVELVSPCTPQDF